MQDRKPISGVRMLTRISILGWLFLHGALLCLAQSPQERGREIFEEKCTECHSIGLGAVSGPDLHNVTARRDEDWLIRFITAPDKMLAVDPVAQKLLEEFDNYEMPNLGLSPEDAAAIIGYIRHSSTASSEVPIAMPIRTSLRDMAKSGRWGLLGFFLAIASTIVLVFASVAYSTNAPSEINPRQALKLRRTILVSLVTVLSVSLAITVIDVPYFAGSTNPDKVVYLTMGQFRSAMSDNLITNKKEWTQHLEKVFKVKAGETVEFRITSVDVNHGAGFYDPNGRILGQTQAMPGYVNRLTLKLEKTGVYTILCLEYCGPAHHAMKAAFKVE
jgi:cytochrome c oxidase subunit 2